MLAVLRYIWGRFALAWYAADPARAPGAADPRISGALASQSSRLRINSSSENKASLLRLNCHKLAMSHALEAHHYYELV